MFLAFIEIAVVELCVCIFREFSGSLGFMQFLLCSEFQKEGETVVAIFLCLHA